MNYKHIITTILTLALLSTVTSADTTISSADLGISAYLPDNWIATSIGDSALFLSDTTFTYRSQIVVKKHPVNTIDYSTAGEWTRAHFIAYMLVVKYSYDPFGAVLYYDSSATATQDSLWSPEAFSEFYSLDTLLDSWNEYIRYTESGTNGYELYAIGDTADMRANAGMYMGIIRLIKFDKSSITRTVLPHQTVLHSTLPLSRTGTTSGTFNLLGRRIAARENMLSGVYCMAEKKVLQLSAE